MRNGKIRRAVCSCSMVMAGAVAWSIAACGAEVQQWDVAGTFLSLKAGQADVAVFEVAEGARIEIPLSALSEANRRVITELTKSKPPSTQAPHPLNDEALVEDGGQAADLVMHAIDLLRLGNPQLAKQELQKASKADPASGEADFVTAIIYAVGARNYEKAVDHFLESVSREPGNAAAVANLALCELHTKQYSNAVNHFRRALELKPDGQAIADNMALAIQAAGAGRARITEKVLADLNDLYRKALVDLKLARLDPGANRALVFHGLNGRPVDPLSPTRLLDAVQRPAETAIQAAPQQPGAAAAQPAAAAAPAPQPD